ncbi:hypothetical protein AACH06_21820 [Ideonella sp. DXS29W]|uniref:Uncharacterized protein n=1 Tax=Ideonella lacteola TaxID=2984193 RepID=A0ABU9BX99_9BURK
MSAASMFIERSGPDMVSYGNLCGPSFSDPCLAPVLKGGFPIAFLFDSPGVSVEHELFVGEDMFQPKAFAWNTAIHALVIGLAVLMARRVRARNNG